MKAWTGMLVVALAPLGASGCGGNSSVPESAEAGELVAEGTVRQVGSAPTVTTRIETGDGPIVVVGPLASEIARAAGAVARVHGISPGDSGPKAIRAESYNLVSVDGLSPLVGVLELEDDRIVLRTEDGQGVELIGGSARMREATGSKVWVTTRDDGRSIVRWGILREQGQ